MEWSIFERSGKPAALPLKEVWIKGDICGLYGEFAVEQFYINEGTKVLEIIYTFPLPDKAVLTGFSARAGKRIIAGEIREKKEAFQSYDEALGKGDSAFLLEQFRPNIFQVSLGRILPGEEVSIKVVYLEAIAYQDGEIRLSIPTLVAPRYIPGKQLKERRGMGWAEPTGQVPDADFITPPVDAKALYRLSLELNLQPLMPVDRFDSPSHKVKVKTGEDGSTQITLAGGPVPLDRDIVIRGYCREESTTAGLGWTDPETGASYFYLNFLPRLEPPSDREPVNYLFLIDISGSMQGSKLEQAKNALQLCLRNMETGDSFNITAFESRCYHFSPAGALPFNQRSLDSATGWIDNLSPRGGTEILEPLNHALNNSAEKGTAILLFTDGQVGNEQEIIDRVSSKIRSNRLFTFGIDTAVNSYFINKLAEAGNGLPEFIYPGERIEDKVIRQFYRINSPVVSDVAVQWSTASAPEYYPRDIPAIFDREPVTLVGKSRGAPAGTVSLTGQLNSTPFSAKLALAALGTADNPRFLQKLWAKAKIEHLETALREINPRRREALIKEIVKISRKYGVGSSQTSFVALHERENKDTNIPETVVVPVAPAAEWALLSRARPTFYTAPAMLSEPSRGALLSLLEAPAVQTGAAFFKRSDTAPDPGSSLQDAVRLIALQQQADGSFPAEEGAVNAALSRFENTALAALALLLAAEELGIYRRQIEKSIQYLMETALQSKIGEHPFFAAALAGKLYLEKCRPGKRTADPIGARMKVMEEQAGSLGAILMKPDLSEKEMIAELLHLTGDGEDNLEKVLPDSCVKTAAAAIFRELLR